MSVQLSIQGLPPKPKEELSQWFTPQNLADRIVMWANVQPNSTVLEPSAGSGAFVRPLLDAGAYVMAVEVDPAWAAELEKTGYQNLEVACADFTSHDPGRTFDLCVMNPPYEDGQDEKHVWLAMQHARRVVALVRANFLHGVDRYLNIWRNVHLTRMVHLSSRPHFSGAGSPRHDFTVVEIAPGIAGVKRRLTTEVDWWRL